MVYQVSVDPAASSYRCELLFQSLSSDIEGHIAVCNLSDSCVYAAIRWRLRQFEGCRRTVASSYVRCMVLSNNGQDMSARD